MKKILIAQEIYKVLQQKDSFLSRADIAVFTATNTDEALQVHGAEHMDLLVLHLDMPGGMKTEQFCSLVREGTTTHAVSIIMVCSNTTSAMEQSLRCGANAVLFRPIRSSLVLAKAKELLKLSWRETYRALLDVSVEGTVSDQLFTCRSLDISSTGMLIETSKTFSPGDSVVCAFILPDTTRIHATGTIARIVPQAPGSTANRYGIHFQSLDNEARCALNEFLSSQGRTVA